LSATSAAAASDCAADKFSDPKTRRAIVVPIVLGCLQNDLDTNICITK
jgi:hypothetical protein